jgi:alpha-glucosidase
VLIDAKWDQWEDAEQAVQTLVAQAESVGVKLLLWYNSGGRHTPSPLETPLGRMLEPDRRDEMAKIAGWGIAGIKVDFFNSDKQDRINQYIGILEDAADFKLLVNFHGATIPRGWQRTYPHLMSHEAVNGAEVYEFASVQGAPDALMNVRHALLRNVVGSMDYTPVVFEAALRTVGLPYAHSLALSVVFESGIQHFADRADSNTEVGYRAVFDAYPDVRDFMSTVPVAWDDTRLVRGDIDDHVILARRKGGDWYLGGIHAVEAPTEYSFNLDFLDPETSYSMVLIEQGENESSFETSTIAVSARDPLSITLQPNGGFVATLTPQ